MTDMEDRCRRNNVRLVGLPEGMEGNDAAGFLRANLSKWIPSLRGRDIEIDQAHRVYDGGRGSDRPRTLIFHVLRWHDRSDILRCSAGLSREMFTEAMSHAIFSRLYPATAIRRKAFGLVLKKMTALGLQPFLIYPAVIKLRHKGNREATIPSESGGFYQLHVSAEVVCLYGKSYGGGGGCSGRCFSSSTGGAWRPGWSWPSCPEGDDAGWTWTLAKPIVCVFFLLLGYCPYLSGTTISLLVRLTLHFFLEGTNGE